MVPGHSSKPRFLRQRNFTSHSLLRNKEGGSQSATPFEKFVRNSLLINGPMSVAEYMQQALVHPRGGFYAREQGVIGGAKADFITSPEISQLFGEMLGLWYIATTPPSAVGVPIQVVELGPGNGTLAADMLRITRNFPQVFNRIRYIDFVEMSQPLRRKQAEALGLDWELVEHCENGMVHRITQAGVECSWYPSLDAVPTRADAFKWITAHEFFDALPVYQFEYVPERRWSEIMVAISKTDDRLSFTINSASTLTKALAALQNDLYYRQVLQSSSTVGDRLEVSPASAFAAHSVATKLSESQHGGLCLIVDYGHEKLLRRSTLRGIKNHKFVHPLSDPGNVDISANVDFGYLKHTFKRCGSDVVVRGPVTQQNFLLDMQIHARLEQLLQLPDIRKSPSTALELQSGVDRLLSAEQMGSTYKVMSVFSDKSLCDPQKLPGFSKAN